MKLPNVGFSQLLKICINSVDFMGVYCTDTYVVSIKKLKTASDHKFAWAFVHISLLCLAIGSMLH